MSHRLVICLFGYALLGLFAKAETVDVLVVYTPSVTTLHGGAAGVEAFAISLIEGANQAYTDSLVDQSLNLVHCVEVSYTENTLSMGTDLDRLTDTDGYMDEVHTLRAAYGADMVCLLRDGNVNSTAGIAWVLASISGRSDLAFSVVASQSASFGTFAHELGHNMGCAHDRDNASTSGLFSYSYGYRFTGSDTIQYRTIMAYAPGTRIMYFSNPNVNYQNTATGVVTSSPSSAYNALTIDTSSAVVSAYEETVPQSATIDAIVANFTSLTGNEASLSAKITGTPTLSTQWYEGEVGDTSSPMAGGANSSLANTVSAGRSLYWVHTSNSNGSADSTQLVVNGIAAWPYPEVFDQQQTSLTYYLPYVSYDLWQEVVFDYPYLESIQIYVVLVGSADSYSLRLLDSNGLEVISRTQSPVSFSTGWQSIDFGITVVPGETYRLEFSSSGTDGNCYSWTYVDDSTDHYPAGSSSIASVFSEPTLDWTFRTKGAQDNRLKTTTDFNNDGFSDLVFQNATNHSLGTRIYDSGGGDFGSNATSGMDLTNLQILALSDFDGDGVSDLFVQSVSSGDVSVKLLDASGNASDGTTFSPGSADWKFVAAYDQNLDGMVDLVWQRVSDGRVSIWLLNFDGSVKSFVTVASSLSSTVFQVGDLDNDGWMDLVSTVLSGGRYYVYGVLLNSNGQVSGASTLSVANVSEEWLPVGLTDVAGDGDLDVIFQNTSTLSVTTYELNSGGVWSGGSSFYGTGASDFRIASRMWDLSTLEAEASDENGDGFADLLWQRRDTSKVLSWRFDGSWNQQYYTVVADNLAPGTLVALADMNSDGTNDYVWSEVSGGTITVRVWLMNSDRTLKSGYQAAALSDTWTLVGVGDINGDDYQDLVWQQSGTGKVISWNQDGAGNTTSYTTIIASLSGFDMWMIEDMNGDGNDDLIWRKDQTTTYKYIIWYMDGAGKASSYATLTQLPVVWTLGAMGDFDEDGNIDAVWYNESLGKAVAWMMNASNRATSYKTVGSGLTAWQLMHW